MKYEVTALQRLVRYHSDLTYRRKMLPIWFRSNPFGHHESCRHAAYLRRLDLSLMIRSY